MTSSSVSVVVIVPPISCEPRPSSVTGRSVSGGVAEQRLLREPGLVPEAVQLPGVDLVPGALQPLLEQPRQRQIHVVAAEQDVLADGDALERQVAIALADRNQAEVGGAAADVADEHEIADLDTPPPRSPSASSQA